GAPAYDVGNVLRRNDVQILHPCRDPDVVQLQQKLASDLQSLIDIEAAVEMRVVDQTLPSYCRTRLFKINAHDDEQFRFVPVPFQFELTGVIDRGLWVVNRTRPDDDQQPVICAMQDAMNRTSCVERGLRGFFAKWKLAPNLIR